MMASVPFLSTVLISRHWTELADAAEALDFLLAERGLSKAEPSILSRAGFDKQLKLFTQELMRKVRSPEGDAVRRMVSSLRQRWGSMSVRARNEAIARAVRSVGALPGVVLPAVRTVIEQRSARIIRQAFEAGAAKASLDVVLSLNVVDQRVIQHTRRSQTMFITNHYGTMEESLSRDARLMVARGLEQGFDNITIGRDLAQRLGPQVAGRSTHYYRTVANIYAQRARTYGHLRTFQEGGIQRFKYQAVLDKNTTEQCRFLHGQVFQVQAALDLYQQISELDDPQGIKDIAPFMQTGRDNSGNQILYFKRGSERVNVARVVKPGFGKIDQRGTYSRAMSPNQLESNGISAPPLHGL
jgi:SPP1 gp7 family putative phage head morphogenesis protein